jgi:hypothetical protein
MVRMPQMSSSTRKTLRRLALPQDVCYPVAYQLKPSRGSSGSGTMDGMAAARSVDAKGHHHGSAKKARIVVVKNGRSGWPQGSRASTFTALAQ